VGAWADKYSRKVVIIRSALVEAVVFMAVALAREPWQLAVAMLLIGFQLGNTGIMLAGIRDVTPRQRLGTAIALFGASGAVGFAIGPALAGILIDGFGWALRRSSRSRRCCRSGPPCWSRSGHARSARR
jgi:MFS family permease